MLTETLPKQICYFHDFRDEIYLQMKFVHHLTHIDFFRGYDIL